MPYVAPSTVVAGQTYGAAAHNVIVNDVIDHESRIKTGIESYTTSARDALTGVATGTMIYNSTEKQVQVYNGSSWIEINDIDNTNGVPSGLAPFFTGWTSWTPALAQGSNGDISKTVNYAKYMRVGKIVWANIRVAITGASGYTNALISLSLPLTAAASAIPVGSGIYYRNASVYYAGVAILNSATTVAIFADDEAGNYVGATPNFATANGDEMSVSICYEIS